MRISILMPSYNQTEFLPLAVESVLDQWGDFDLELIVIDGGSTDDSTTILRSYGDRIRWLSEPDDGQADALNKGLRMASGEVIGWLNSDDLYAPGCLDAIASVFQQEPQTKWLYGKVQIVDAEGNEVRKAITRYKNWRMRKFGFRKLLTENWISQMGVFWRREASDLVGEFRRDLHFAMDYDYWLRLGQRWPGRYLDRNLASFRWHGNSKTNQHFVKQSREAFQTARRTGSGHSWPLFLHRMNMLKLQVAYSLMRAAGY